MTDNAIQIPRADADRLLACADGLCALLYLLQRTGGDRSRRETAALLKCSGEELERAYETLRRLGLAEKPERPPEQRELPEYEAGDITARSETDGAFSAVVFEAQRALGRVLSSNDLRILFGLYDHLGMPAEVIMPLINHCTEEYQRRYGEGRKPTMKYIEKAAWDWADQEIITAEAAEEHLALLRSRRETVGQFRQALQLTGRDLTPTEDKYLRSWAAMGFGPEAVALAYDRTVISTGKLTWRYMDKILQSWSEKRLFTPEEIEAGDPPRRGARSAPAAGGQERVSSLDEKVAAMRRLNEHLKRRED